MNRITLIGNVGKEPEIRTLESGAKVAVFTLATKDRAFTLPNGTQVPERTEWCIFPVLLRDGCSVRFR